jgi:hypothetical protein
MQVNLDFEYNKLHLKEVVILMPKKHPNVVSFLTPLLSLYGINVKDFINNFEELTKFISFDMIIPIKVKITKIKTFKILPRTPYVVSILSDTVDLGANSSVNILDIYKLCLLKSVFIIHSHASPVSFFRPTVKVYLWLRKYLSMVVVGELLTKVDTTINLLQTGDLFSIRRTLISLSNFAVLVSNQFGVFVTFNNLNGASTVELKTTLSLVSRMCLTRIKPKFLSTLTGMGFYGHIYYFSARYFN